MSGRPRTTSFAESCKPVPQPSAFGSMKVSRPGVDYLFSLSACPNVMLAQDSLAWMSLSGTLLLTGGRSVQQAAPGQGWAGPTERGELATAQGLQHIAEFPTAQHQ
ncbi:hypothetical protein CRENBAI_025088 [Crenichthys baileyi]|uniref:Uncharacterized protein n=1 Tax=Crenichthys baileyi TaxID=28760 RepID=A0AAV9QZ76_9TELE